MVQPAGLQAKQLYDKQTILFKVFGLWRLPKQTRRALQIAYRVHFWHMLIFWVLFFDYSLARQFVHNIASLNEILSVFTIFATSISVLVKFLNVKVKNQSYEAIYQAMYSAEFAPGNAREEQIFAEAIQRSRTIRNGYATISLIALQSMEFVTSTKQLPISLYSPISLDSIGKYCIVYLYQYIALSACCLTNIAFDSLSASFFIYLRAHLDILSYRLQQIGANVTQDITHMQLKNAMKYYYKIIKLTKRIESVVTIPMSVQIACSILVLIANFYAMTLLSEPGDYLNIVRFFVYQICMLFQIFMACFFANEILLTSRDLPMKLYESNWMYWNQRNRHLMLQMMLHLANPICVNTINRCYSFNLTAFTAIVNSSYSYFTLLKNMNSKR